MLSHSDILQYLNLNKAFSPSIMGLRKLNYPDPQKNKTFQIDSNLSEFIENKQNCILENKGKYFKRALNLDISNIEKYIVDTLDKEYPGYNKDKYTKFDDLATILPEDLIVHCFNGKRDWAEAISLCNANGWGADHMINWTFDQIHDKVPRMNEIGQGEKITKMIKAIIDSDHVFERIAAINFKTTPKLNMHPDNEENCLDFHSKHNPNLFIRFERQTIKGFKSVGTDKDSPAGFLFTIRTYFVNIALLEKEQKQFIKQCFENPNPKLYSYDFIIKNRDQVLDWLNKE